MLTEVKNLVRYIVLSTKYNMKSALEYKKSFIIQTVFMFINNGFFLIFWLVITDVGGENAAGIPIKQILYVWSIGTLPWGIANFFFGGIKELSRYIITGQLDSYIIQPKNTLLGVATSKCHFSAFGDLLYGFVLGIWVSDSILDFFAIILFGVLGTIILISVITIVRVLAIWIGDMENIAHVYENSLLITFCIYPEQIFGKTTKFLMYTVIPAAYMVHIPIKIIEKFNIISFIIVFVVTIILICISSCIFKLAMRKYESGNNITLRG